MKVVPYSWILLLGLLPLPGWTQEVTVDVPVQVFGETNVTGPGSNFTLDPSSVGSIGIVEIDLASLQDPLNPEVCGGIGDPVSNTFNRLQELAQALPNVRTETERFQLEQEIYELAQALPEEILRDFGNRDIKLGESESCDSLIRAMTELQKRVLNYVKALEASRTAIYW
jgi:hypothetical protein